MGDGEDCYVGGGISVLISLVLIDCKSNLSIAGIQARLEPDLNLFVGHDILGVATLA